MEAFLKCPTKCFLRSRDEVGTGNAYADWLRTRSEFFRTEGLKHLAATVTPNKCVTGTPIIGGVRSAQWQLATGFHARSQNLECFCHAVGRIPPTGGGRGAQLVPIRFVASNKVTRDDKLLLSFDALVLSEMLGRKIALGKIVHGDNYTTLKVKTSDLADAARKLTDKISMLITNSSAPNLVLNRHCAECEFQTRCRQRALEKDDLSLLASMTEKERMGYNRKGIFTVTQLSYTFRPRRQPDRLKDKRERYHHSLKALAIRENKIHIVGRPEMKIEGTPVYLDVEGLPIAASIT